MIDLIVGQFEGRRSDAWQGSKASYVGWSLEGITDQALADLGEFLGLSALASNGSHHELGVVEVSDAHRIWSSAPCFRLFVSHISAFKAEATKLKDALSAFGITAFVAHADIQPTKEWLEEILRALKTMDALAVLLVPDFHKSNWTDQEVGYALARNVPILPLKFSQDPYGFIGRFQALNCANISVQQTAHAIARLLIENSASQTAMADAVGRRLAKAGTYADARSLVELLEIPTSLPKATLDLVATAKSENDQVQDSWGVPDRITNLFQKHSYTELPQSMVTREVETDEIPF